MPFSFSIVCLLAYCLVFGPLHAANANSPDCVVLLHGLGRTPVSMKRMEWFLIARGYRVINVRYPSTRSTVEDISNKQLQRALSGTGKHERVHFVAHSMGGIVLRQYLADHSLPNLGRVVMLAPPNQGSEVIDYFKRNAIARRILGPGGMTLGTSERDVPHKLGNIDFECGVIACDRSFNPLLSSLFPGPNDGKVSVERTKIDGMSDFILLHNTHTWMMWRKQTLQQTLTFLESGRFSTTFENNDD